uniref:Transcription termination factor MTEF1, chloroplastic n=1 Tax=Ananas comosus var. bracteatus TaxID=296719 RepID=A0A6V7PSN2_ANACO|nr:unnamed protein product [Ananas comosus var. bracteatus]
MEEILSFPLCPSSPIPKLPSRSQNSPRRRPPRPRFPAARAKLHAPVPPIAPIPKIHPSLPKIPLSSSSSFEEKLLFLDSLGVDLASGAAAAAVARAPIGEMRAAAAALVELGLGPGELRRCAGMCPEILAAAPETIAAAAAFLRREAGVPAAALPRVIRRRPRLLVSSVPGRLRPTLYFLQTLGISPISRHATLLSCSVEEKLLPRLEFLESAGFSRKEARAMARRFPQLMCYSIEGNLRPKLGFLLDAMGRSPVELREFPHYFSFGLDGRIRPRHIACEERGVRLPLPAMLRPGDERFRARLDVCVGSSPPMRSSPLWQQSLEQVYGDHDNSLLCLERGKWRFSTSDSLLIA